MRPPKIHQVGDHVLIINERLGSAAWPRGRGQGIRPAGRSGLARKRARNLKMHLIPANGGDSSPRKGYLATIA